MCFIEYLFLNSVEEGNSSKLERFDSSKDGVEAKIQDLRRHTEEVNLRIPVAMVR